ncbi:MAG: hemerythrin domain-containing protein [bacterium]
MDRKPTDVLAEEHRIIEKVLKSVAILIKKLESGNDVDLAELKNITEFMTVFGDKCHQGKEETELFPLLQMKETSIKECPLAILINEHDKLRMLVRNLSTAVISYEHKDISARKTLVTCFRGLLDVYSDHFWKEENVLFPMTNKILNDDEQEYLEKRFAAVEKEIGADTHYRYKELADVIEEKTIEL